MSPVAEERTGFASANVLVRHGASAAFAERTKAEFGLELPATPGRGARENVELIWSGPHRWLAIANGIAEPEWVARLSRVYAGVAGVSPQSSGQVIVRVAGPCVRDALAKVCALDLHSSVFGPDAAALTKLSQVAVHLWRVGESDAFDIAMPRSYSRYLCGALSGAGVLQANGGREISAIPTPPCGRQRHSPAAAGKSSTSPLRRE